MIKKIILKNLIERINKKFCKNKFTKKNYKEKIHRKNINVDVKLSSCVPSNFSRFHR